MLDADRRQVLSLACWPIENNFKLIFYEYFCISEVFLYRKITFKQCCGSRIQIFTHAGSRIQKQQQKRGVKKSGSATLLLRNYFPQQLFFKMRRFANFWEAFHWKSSNSAIQSITKFRAKFCFISQRAAKFPHSVCRNVAKERFFCWKKNWNSQNSVLNFTYCHTSS
jgi:hypothetical protein